MPSKLGVHWQRTHPDDGRDRAIFERWKPKSVKLITVGDDVKGAELVPSESLLVVRHHPMSENWGQRGIQDVARAREMARAHAAKCKVLADWLRQNVPGRDLDNTAFTGLNEPEVWDREPPGLTAAYYAAFLQELHRYGLRGVALNLGVGHPTNGGVPDAPPIWQPYAPVMEAMHPGDFLGKHGYWDERGPEFNFKWWGGDWTQIPFNVPILIGECGLDKYVSDGGVPASRRGWRGWLNAQEYMNQLAWYDARLRADPRVHSAQVFTFDFAHPWDSFNVREADFMESLFLPYVQGQQNTPEPEPEPTPEPEPGQLPDFIRDVVDVLPKHATLRYQKRTAKVDGIAIHHTAGPVTGDMATPEGIARIHILPDASRNKDAWPGIAYHVFITPDGTAYLTNRLETMSYHVANENNHLVGVCFVGDATEAPMTAAQLTTGKKVLAWLLQELNLKPENVKGHGDWQTAYGTECPGGDWWRALLDAPPPDVTAVRWNAEEAAREARDGKGQEAHDRLVRWVIPYLRKVEGVG